MSPPLIATVILALTSASTGVNPGESAWNAWLAGDFRTVERIADSLAADTAVAAPQRARILLALGCSRAVQGDAPAAEDAFQRALALDLMESITSADLPPPAWQLFARVRSEMAKPPQPAREPAGETSVTSQSPRDTVWVERVVERLPPAAAQSLLFPGWGHITAGCSRGWYFAGAEVALLTGLAVSAVNSAAARDDYMQAEDSDVIASRYSEYNDWHRLTWGFAWAAVGTYLAAQYDFFILKRKGTIRATAVGTPARLGDGLQIVLGLRF